MLLCFRIEGKSKNELMLIVTDKLGQEQQKMPLSSFDRVICDYTSTLNNLFNFNVRLSKRAEIKSSTFTSLWERIQTNNEEDSFDIDRVRNVG